MHRDYCLASVPFLQHGDQNPTSQFALLQSRLGPSGQALRHFIIPQLKVGTLDSLMEASDDLTKLDPQVEGVCQKLMSLLEEATGRERKNITIPFSAHQEANCETFWKQFSWNSTHYNPKDPLKTLLDRFTKEAMDAEERIRLKLAEYNEIRQKLAAASRRGQGSLNVRPIAEDVSLWCRKMQMEKPVETEFLTTAFVAVPLSQQKEWYEQYWQIHQFVCPQSSQPVCQDGDFALMSCVMFKKATEDFKLGCRKKKFIVREMEASDELTADEFRVLQSKSEEEKISLTKLLLQQFATSFSVWGHIKAVRVFVESLLKYGLPPKFISCLVAVDEKREGELRKGFQDLYPELQNSFDEEQGQDIGALQYEYGYVSLKVTNLLKQR